MTGQLPLDLRFPTDFATGDFVVGPANERAVVWLSRWREWPGFGLLLYGPAGVGKSHLAAIWARATGAVCVTGAQLSDELERLTRRPLPAVLLDEAEGSMPRAFYALINGMKASGGRLLVVGRTPARDMPFELPDLVSRLRGLPAVGIGEPDDILLERLIERHMADRRLGPSPGVARFLARRIERTADAARAVVAELDRRSLALHRAPTIALARSLPGLGVQSDDGENGSATDPWLC